MALCKGQWFLHMCLPVVGIPNSTGTLAFAQAFLPKAVASFRALRAFNYSETARQGSTRGNIRWRALFLMRVAAILPLPVVPIARRAEDNGTARMFHAFRRAPTRVPDARLIEAHAEPARHGNGVDECPSQNLVAFIVGTPSKASVVHTMATESPLASSSARSCSDVYLPTALATLLSSPAIHQGSVA